MLLEEFRFIFTKFSLFLLLSKIRFKGGHGTLSWMPVMVVLQRVVELIKFVECEVV